MGDKSMGPENITFYLKCALTALSLLAALFLLAAQTFEAVVRWRSHLPPGPMGWPVVGSLYSLPGPKSIPACRKFATLAQKYGPIMFLRMGSRPTLIVSNYKIAKDFFDKDHDKNFDSRPRLATGKHFGYDYSSTVFSSGKQFDMMKKIYKSELLSPTNVKKLAPLRMDEIRVLLGDILRRSETKGLVNVTSVVFKANLNLMGRIIFSQRLFGDHREATADAPPREIENFKFFVKSATKLVGLFNIGDYIPALRWLDLQGDDQTHTQFPYFRVKCSFFPWQRRHLVEVINASLN